VITFFSRVNCAIHYFIVIELFCLALWFLAQPSPPRLSNFISVLSPAAHFPAKTPCPTHFAYFTAAGFLLQYSKFESSRPVRYKTGQTVIRLFKLKFACFLGELDYLKF